MVCKTGKKDSAMAIDQAGEQGNKVIKSVAGGLNTVHQQNDAFRTWSIAAPEIVRCVAEYELLTQTSDRSSAELLREEERRKSFFITSSNNIKLGLVTQRPLPSRKLDRERYTMAPSIKLVRPKNS